MLGSPLIPATSAGHRRLPDVRWTLAGLGVAIAMVTARTVRAARDLRRAARHVRALDHDTSLGAGTGQPLGVVVLGDSAAAGHGIASADDAFPRQVAARLATATGRAVRLTSLARDGARTSDVLAEQVAVVHEQQPDVVVVGVGVNDALGRRTTRQVHAETSALLDALGGAAPGAAVVLVGCPDLGVAPGLPMVLRPLVGARCRAVARAQRRAAEQRRVRFVDTGALLRHLPAGSVRGVFGVDGFHPGARGAAMLAEHTVGILSTEPARDRKDDHGPGTRRTPLRRDGGHERSRTRGRDDARRRGCVGHRGVP